MTLLHAPTGEFSKKTTIMFSDFVSSTTPFGALLSTTVAGTSTLSISNSSSNEFGAATIEVPASSTAPLRARAALMLCRPLTGGGTIVDRSFRLDSFEESSFSARIKTDVSASGLYCGVGFTASHSTQDTLAEQAIGFFARGSDTTWSAYIIVDSATIFSFNTRIPKTEYSILTTFVRRDLRRTQENWLYVDFFADGQQVAQWNGSVGAMFEGSKMVPGAEIRDKNTGGSGVAGQSFTVDFMEFYGKHVERT